MATTFDSNVSSYFAAADLSGKQYYFVKLDELIFTAADNWRNQKEDLAANIELI